MNDIRRTILWVIFGFSMVLLWDQWQIHNGKKATFFPGATPARRECCRACRSQAWPGFGCAQCRDTGCTCSRSDTSRRPRCARDS